MCLEKLGYFSSSPGHSCKHIRDSGDSTGDGEYWIDPEKNGRPLKVLCDMTTDGGKEKNIYYIDTDDILGFSLFLKNRIFIARSEGTIFIFHM